MIMHKITAALIASLLLLSLSCTDKVAGGGDVTETGNAKIKIILIDDSTGAPITASKARILTFDDEIMRVIKSDTTVVSTSNTINLKLKNTKKYFVECSNANGELAACRVILAQSAGVNGSGGSLTDSIKDLTLNFSLKKRVRYEGYINIPASYRGTTWEKTIRLAGTHFAADVEANGRFTIDSVPQASYSVFVELSNGTDTQVLVSASRNITMATVAKTDTLPMLLTSSKNLVLDDFEDLDNMSNLWKCLGGSWWDIIDGARQEGGLFRISQVTTPQISLAETFAQAITKDSTSGSNFLSIIYVVDSVRSFERTFPFAGLKQWIGKGRNRLYDFSKADSVTFRAKGNGAIRLELLQEIFDENNKNLKIVAGKRFKLTGEWQSCVVYLKQRAGQSDSAFYTELLWPWYDPVVDSNNTWPKGGYANLPAVCARWKLPAYVLPPTLYSRGDSACTAWSEMKGRINQVDILADSGSQFSIDDITVHGVDLDDIIK